MTGEDVLRGYVEFQPIEKTGNCRSIRLVQIAKVETQEGKDFFWDPSGGESARNILTTTASDAGVLPGFFIDHQAHKCTRSKGCSPYFRDHWSNESESSDGWVCGSNIKSASLVDYPFGWTQFESIKLETCARCDDDGRFLKCLQWGARWPENGERSIDKALQLSAPSPTFIQAFKKFLEYYSEK